MDIAGIGNAAGVFLAHRCTWLRTSVHATIVRAWPRDSASLVAA